MLAHEIHREEARRRGRRRGRRQQTLIGMYDEMVTFPGDLTFEELYPRPESTAVPAHGSRRGGPQGRGGRRHAGDGARPRGGRGQGRGDGARPRGGRGQGRGDGARPRGGRGRRIHTRRPATGRRRRDAAAGPGRAPSTGGRRVRYLIEFRFHGMAKGMMRDIARNVQRHNAGARQQAARHRMVPHITLAGSLATGDEGRLVREVVSACKKHKIVKFRLDGFARFDKSVIHVKINPSPSLVSLQKDIVGRLDSFCEMGEHDHDSPFKFHGTIHMDKSGIQDFDKVWKYVKSFSIPEFELYVARVTVLKSSRILCEYDLVLGRNLSRREALSKSLAEQTGRRLDEIVDPPAIDYLQIDDREKVWLISDLHFDHDNIIRYSKRPFPDTDSMNRAMVENWTGVVGHSDRVFFLGDMAHGRGHRPIDHWLEKLTGRIWFIRGNHDKNTITRANVLPTNYGILYRGRKFLLVHDPYRPDGFDGWLIHGDKHNTDLRRFPLVNQKRKAANVSAELVDYTPISLDRLIDLIDTGRTHRTV